MADYSIVFDGGSKGNPGKGYGSYQISRARDDKTRIRRLEFPGKTTNNEAEYLTLIEALTELIGGIKKAGNNASAFSVHVQGDSQLVINQVAGRWKVNEPRLKPLRDKTQMLLGQFGSHQVVWQPREKSVEVLGH